MALPAGTSASWANAFSNMIYDSTTETLTIT